MRDPKLRSHRSLATQLARAPELALVALVDDALDTLAAALTAAHPQVVEAERPLWRAPSCLGERAARRVLRDARRLHASLTAYHALTVATAPPSRLPHARDAQPLALRPSAIVVELPELAPEEAALVHQAFTHVACAVIDRYAGPVADLLARRADLDAEDADDPEDDRIDDLPF